ncbi:MAG: sorbosone dehydrogenase family protein, partial [Okeania sp. SIO3H1]|nr:sorbosone dehydrogenase family protein [Okeania sp. SIO3H1]
YPVLQVPDGFTVNVFAENLESPRWLEVTPTGDVLVTETPLNQIRLLRDTDGDGTVDFSQVFADAENGLNQPFGMAFTEDYFYVGNTDSVVRYPYNIGDLEINGTGEKIADLPTGGHWTRNLAISPDHQLFVSIGSLSNVSVEPLPRASVQVMNLDGSNQQTFAFGLRNPVGLDFHPITNQLFTTVNERDRLGDDLVPDYLTGLELGEFYGWPYAYLSPNLEDPRRAGENPNLVAETQTPDVLFQAHSAPLGLQFYDGETFPEEYQNGAFVAFRGSWNRQEPTGYKLVFVPFDENGNSTGEYRDFLTGFLDISEETTWGRPTGLEVLPDGSLLFTEEMNNRIYRIQRS